MVSISYFEDKYLQQVPDLIKQYKDNYNGEWGNLETNVDGMINKYSKLKGNSNYIFVQAIESNKLIGFAEVVINEDIVEDQKPIAIIWDLRVDKQHRSQGIGQGIMEFIESHCKRIGVSFIMLDCDIDNFKAQSFYEKCGYTKGCDYFKYLQ